MKSLYIFIILTFSLPIQSQVGINTKLPQGIFHLDAKENTSGSNNIGDDIIITQEGNLGIGTLTPSTKLHIVSSETKKGFALQDGSQGKNYILVSDNNGNAYWTESEVSEFTIISNTSSATTSFAGNTYKYDPGLRITFSKYGTYSTSLVVRLVMNRTSYDTPLVKVQLVPAGSTIGYIGSSQVIASPIASTIYHQAYINQNIEVNTSTGLVARLEFSISAQFSATTGTLATAWSGTYIRVK